MNLLEMNLSDTVAYIDHALAESSGYDLSSTQISLSPELSAQLQLYSAQNIKERDLAGDGREMNPHITVKYGLHTSSPDGVAAAVSGFGKVRYRLGDVSKFECTDFDVVIVKVESKDLHRLNSRIKNRLACTDTYPTYKPHITIAYVKKGFVVPSPVDHFEGVLGSTDTLEFSPKNDKVVKLSMRSSLQKESNRRGIGMNRNLFESLRVDTVWSITESSRRTHGNLIEAFIKNGVGGLLPNTISAKQLLKQGKPVAAAKRYARIGNKELSNVRGKSAAADKATDTRASDTTSTSAGKEYPDFSKPARHQATHPDDLAWARRLRQSTNAKFAKAQQAGGAYPKDNYYNSNN